MRKSLPIGLLAVAIIAQTGCSICAPGYLDDYGAVGGKWERVNPTDGRVGSILSDPGTTVGMPDSGEVYYEDGEYETDQFYDDGAAFDDGAVYYDDTPIYDQMPESVAPYTSPSDGGVIILEDQS